ncbi:MAG TPA: hypothetical protein VN222_02400 [Novosphingobium sp.]|nr:hypothetical protein [Novosphingobium sp.]
MSRKILSRAMMTAGGLAMAATPVLAGSALAQSTTTTTTTTTRQTSTTYGDPYAGQQGYQGQQQGGYDYRNTPPPAYADQGNYPDQGGYDVPPEPTAPPGYDGSALPPPPAGYASQGDMGAIRAADMRYAAEAQAWARDNCVKSKGDVAGGALVGGILGAIVGGGLAGRGNVGAGMAVGGILGAGAGAAVASSSGGDTSPGCPPGYVVRRGAVAYSYAPTGYYYAAPAWYRPWVFTDGAWLYRPYPYHDWYWRTYRGPGPGGWHGGGPRGGYGGRGGHWRR